MKPMKPASQLVCPTEMKKWPKLASIKYDGVRAVIKDGQVLSNSLKPIPNLYVQQQLASLPEGLDGELTLRGDAGKEYNNNQSAFMSQGGKPDFVYRVFDDFSRPELGYDRRIGCWHGGTDWDAPVEIVKHVLIHSPELALVLYDQVREDGYEGLILRDPNAPYKFGRSTLNQEWGLKMKPCEDDEAIIIGFTELEHNENEAFDNELGYQRRSAHQENKVAGNTLGSLICDYNGSEFRIGTGFTAAQRAEIWRNKESWHGLHVKFKHQGITKYGVPRGPAVFVGVRHEEDL